MAVNFEDGQVVFDNDLEALSRAIEGTGILSGWTTGPKSPAGMSVDVALGVGYIGSSKKETAETTNVAIAASDATKARRDIIIWDTSEGELAAVTGTAEAILPYGETDFKKMSHPAPPDIPAGDDILIAQVYIAAGTSSIVTADIWEKRYILPFTKQPGAVSGLATLDASGDVPDAQIPNLAASKITSEQFGLARMPRGTDSLVLTGTGAGTNPAYEAAPGALLTVAETEVFTGTSPTTWTDLDLSGTIGANVALVVLKHFSAGGNVIAFRKNGDTDEHYDASAVDAKGCALVTGGGVYLIFLVMADSGGIIEWKTSAATESTTVDVIGFIK